MLNTALTDGSRQDEKVNIERFDRFGSKAYNLRDLGIKFYLVPFKADMYKDGDGKRVIESVPLPPEIGSYKVKFSFPCDERNTTCVEG